MSGSASRGTTTCGKATKVFRSEQRPAGRYRRRHCPDGHRCTTIERALPPGEIGDAGEVIERAAYAVDTLRELVGTARRLLGGPLPPPLPRGRHTAHRAPESAVQED